MQSISATFRTPIRCLAVLLGLAASFPAAAAEDKGPIICAKKLIAQGTPSRLEAVASMNAVQMWIEMAEQKHGAEKAMWHNARNTVVKCVQHPGSVMYYCNVTARPCPPGMPIISAAGPN